jgi:hypothetical protein
MHSPYKTGIIFCLAWLGIRFGIGKFLEPEIALKAGIMLNILFVLMSIFFVFYFTKKKQGFPQTNVIEDLKLSLKGGIVYVVFVSFGIYAFYTYIDDSIFVKKQNDIELEISKLTKEEIIERKNSNEATKDNTSEEYIELIKKNSQSLANSKTQTMISALGLTVWCLFAALLCTFIFRKVLLSPKALGSK